MKYKCKPFDLFAKKENMVVVIFEAYPKQGKRDAYFDIASTLKPSLSKMEGFISIERFQSLTHHGKVLSLSYWKDEESVAQWRNLAAHRDAQETGRAVVFDDYRLRVALVTRDYGMTDRTQAPLDSKARHQ